MHSVLVEPICGGPLYWWPVRVSNAYTSTWCTEESMILFRGLCCIICLRSCSSSWGFSLLLYNNLLFVWSPLFISFCLFFLVSRQLPGRCFIHAFVYRGVSDLLFSVLFLHPDIWYR